MLMDSQNPDIQRLLEFKLVKKVTTVYDYLKSKDSLLMLKCPDMLMATTAIVDRGRTRAEVQQAIKCKESAVKRIVRKFSNDDLGEEEIEWCLYSIGRPSPSDVGFTENIYAPNFILNFIKLCVFVRVKP